MNSTKLLLATLVGGIVNFIAGWAVWELLMKNMMMGYISESGKSLMLPEDQMGMGYFVLAGLAYAGLYAYIFERANIRSLMSGAIAGAIIGTLISINFDAGFLGSTNIYTGPGAMIINIISYIISGGLTGAAVAWTLGYNRN